MASGGSHEGLSTGIGQAKAHAGSTSGFFGVARSLGHSGRTLHTLRTLRFRKFKLRQLCLLLHRHEGYVRVRGKVHGQSIDIWREEGVLVARHQQRTATRAMAAAVARRRRWSPVEHSSRAGTRRIHERKSPSHVARVGGCCCCIASATHHHLLRRTLLLDKLVQWRW